MSVRTLSLSSVLLRQSLTSIEHVVGTIGLNAVLRKAAMEQFINSLPNDECQPNFTAGDYARLNQAVEDFFGRGSPAILRKIGEVAFENLLIREFTIQGLMALSNDSSTDLLKCQIVLTEIAHLAAHINPSWQVTVRVFDPGIIEYTSHQCPICSDRHSNHPICHVLTGALTSAIRFATRRTYRVEETQCIAMGATHCQFNIHVVAPIFATQGPAIEHVFRSR